MKALVIALTSFFGSLIPEIDAELSDKPVTRRSFILLWLGTPFALVLMAVGGFFFFASADDLSDARKNVQIEIDVLKGNVDSIKNEVKSIKRSVDISAELQLADKIRNLIERRCRSHDPVAKANIGAVIEEWQIKYREITGSRYQATPCSEL